MKSVLVISLLLLSSLSFGRDFQTRGLNATVIEPAGCAAVTETEKCYKPSQLYAAGYVRESQWVGTLDACSNIVRALGEIITATAIGGLSARFGPVNFRQTGDDVTTLADLSSAQWLFLTGDVTLMARILWQLPTLAGDGIDCITAIIKDSALNTDRDL